jgi:hypothetical protein
MFITSFVDPDPDPHGSALISVGWIRIQEGKNEEFHVLMCWMFSYEGRRRLLLQLGRHSKKHKNVGFFQQ